MLWLPLTNEGQYWITASVGIVLGLWFLGWAWVFLARFVQRRGSRWSLRIEWVAMTLAFLAADLCYEQYWFSVNGLMAVISLAYRRQWLSLVGSPLLSLMLTALWYLSHSSGMRDNGKVANHSLTAVIHSFHLVLPQIMTIWGNQELDALKLGVHFGHVPWWWLSLVIVLSLAAVWLAVGDYNTARVPPNIPPRIGAKGNLPWILAGSGIIWVLASYVPWLMTHYDWVADRSVTVAAPGIGLLGNVLVTYARQIGWRPLRGASVAVFTFLLVAMINLRAQDIVAYTVANSFSARMGSHVLKILNQHHVKEGGLTVADSAWTFAPWTYTYHDHISTGWDDHWVIHNMLADLSQGRNLYSVTVLWPGDPQRRAPSAQDTGVILTPLKPSLNMVRQLDVHQAVVIQYQDQFPAPRILRTKWFNMVK